MDVSRSKFGSEGTRQADLAAKASPAVAQDEQVLSVRAEDRRGGHRDLGVRERLDGVPGRASTSSSSSAIARAPSARGVGWRAAARPGRARRRSPGAAGVASPGAASSVASAAAWSASWPRSVTSARRRRARRRRAPRPSRAATARAAARPRRTRPRARSRARPQQRGGAGQQRSARRLTPAPPGSAVDRAARARAAGGSVGRVLRGVGDQRAEQLARRRRVGSLPPRRRRARAARPARRPSDAVERRRGPARARAAAADRVERGVRARGQRVDLARGRAGDSPSTAAGELLDLRLRAGAHQRRSDGRRRGSARPQHAATQRREHAGAEERRRVLYHQTVESRFSISSTGACRGRRTGTSSRRRRR